MSEATVRIEFDAEDTNDAIAKAREFFKDMGYEVEELYPNGYREGHWAKQTRVADELIDLAEQLDALEEEEEEEDPIPDCKRNKSRAERREDRKFVDRTAVELFVRLVDRQRLSAPNELRFLAPDELPSRTALTAYEHALELGAAREKYNPHRG